LSGGGVGGKQRLEKIKGMFALVENKGVKSSFLTYSEE
jgi:hypothetical protein